MIFSAITYFFERKIKPGFKIKKNQVVIDIGSGDKPFWRGNVFLDNLNLKNLHRHTDMATVNNLGPFVDSDISKTDFKNKAFDFAFCAHLLEHVNRPDLAINEITRISKRGYVEVPNGVIEYISPFHSHIWFIFLVKKKLIFIRKGKVLHNILLANGQKYYPLISKTKDPFIRLYWKDKIDYEIIDNLNEKEKYFPPEKTPKTRKNTFFLHLSNYMYLSTVKMLRTMYSVSSSVDIKKLLNGSKTI